MAGNPSLLITALAYAQQQDLSGSDWRVIVLCLGAVGGVAILALLAIATARSRMPRWTQGVALASVVWGVAAAGSIISILVARLHWSAEQDLLLKTGYYDPADATPAPAYPWLVWGILGALYGVVMAGMVILDAVRQDRPKARG